MDPIARVVSRRIGRVVSGAVLLAGGGLLAIEAVREESHCGCGRAGDVHASTILAGAWLVAVLAGLFAWSLARRGRWTNPRALERLGFALPAAGIAGLLPLTLHMPFAIALGGQSGFDEWVAISLVVTGIPHLVFAGCAIQRGCDLGARGITQMSTRRMFGWVVIASCIPWLAAFGVPPVLVMLTIMPCLVPMVYMESLARCEQGWLDDAGLPHAIALR